MTGAAGKIGSHVVLELARHGHEVLALDRRPVSAEVQAAAEVLYGDITDPLALLNAARGCDALAHLAAIPHPHRRADEGAGSPPDVPGHHSRVPHSAAPADLN